MLSIEERLYGLGIYWKEAEYNFAFFDRVPDVDWDREYQAALPGVVEAESLDDYYQVLRHFAARLRDGHSTVLIPKQLHESQDRPPIQLVHVGNQLIVANIAERILENIPIGSEVIAVDGVAVDEYEESTILPQISGSSARMVKTLAAERLLFGPRAVEVTLTIETPFGELREVSIARNERSSDHRWHLRPNRSSVRRLPLLEDLFYGGTNIDSDGPETIDDGISYLWIRSLMAHELVDLFRNNIDNINKTKGLVIDLRGCAGGVSQIGTAICRHLITRPARTYTFTSRNHNGFFKSQGAIMASHGFNDNDANHQSEDERILCFNKDWWRVQTPEDIEPATDDHVVVPIVVLIDRTTMSAAEDFVHICSQDNQITLLGENTMGSSGQPLIFPLPGDGLGSVCTVRGILESGEEFPVNGFCPTIEVQLSQEEIKSGKDVFLSRARELL